MKRLLVLTVVLATMSQVARADHIGLYTDASGASCALAPGFTSLAAVIHKFSSGATGSHFAINFPAGTSVYAFNSIFTVLGFITSDITIQYGACLTGTFMLGTIDATLVPGTIYVVAAAGFPSITVTDCSNVEHVARGGQAYVGGTGDCGQPVATEANTWGAVKALYH
jgi:hypothetical protein